MSRILSFVYGSGIGRRTHTSASHFLWVGKMQPLPPPSQFKAKQITPITIQSYRADLNCMFANTWLKIGAKSCPRPILFFQINLIFVFFKQASFRCRRIMYELDEKEYLFYIIFYHSPETINVGNREIWEGGPGQGADGGGGKERQSSRHQK